MSLKLQISAVGFFLGHPVYTEIGMRDPSVTNFQGGGGT